MTNEVTAIEVAPGELGSSLRGARLCSPEARAQMERSFAQLGQLTPVLAWRTEAGLEVYDGFKRCQAAQALSWRTVRVEVHALDAVGAKVRLLLCNAVAGLSELEEAWLIRALHREDRLNQPQIAMLLGRDKSWVCRRLALAENLSDELTANVRLGLVSTTAVRELARLPRGNQDEVGRVVARRGLTTRQTARLVEALLAAPAEQWPQLLEHGPGGAGPDRKPSTRRTPGEQIVADAWSMKRIGVRLHARLLERPLATLGEPAVGVVAAELAELRAALVALERTLSSRLDAGEGERNADRPEARV